MSDITELYEKCRTYRRFAQEKVPDSVLSEMVQTASRRSSARNAQIIRYVVVRSPEMTARMQPLVKWAGALPPEIGHPHDDETPTAFIVLYFEGKPSPVSYVDLGIVCDTLSLVAVSHGYGTCTMGAINAPEIKKLLGIPDEAVLPIVMPVGRPVHTSRIVDVPASGSLAYYTDSERNYYVPKLKLSDVARFV